MYKQNQITDAMNKLFEMLYCKDCPLKTAFFTNTSMKALTTYFNHEAETVRKYEVRCEVPTMVDFRSEELFPVKAVHLFDFPEIYAQSDDGIETTFYKELWLLEDLRLMVVSNYCIDSDWEESTFTAEYRTVEKEMKSHEDFPIPQPLLMTQLAIQMHNCKNQMLPIYEI